MAALNVLKCTRQLPHPNSIPGETHLAPFGNVVAGDEFDGDRQAVGDAQAGVDGAEAALSELLAHLVFALERRIVMRLWLGCKIRVFCKKKLNNLNFYTNKS